MYPLNEHWSLIGRYYYSLLDKRLLEAFGGAQYDSCCVALRVLVRRYITSIGQVQPNNGLYFELEFKGLGNTGTRTENSRWRFSATNSLLPRSRAAGKGCFPRKSTSPGAVRGLSRKRRGGNE